MSKMNNTLMPDLFAQTPSASLKQTLPNRSFQTPEWQKLINPIVQGVSNVASGVGNGLLDLAKVPLDDTIGYIKAYTDKMTPKAREKYLNQLGDSAEKSAENSGGMVMGGAPSVSEMMGGAEGVVSQGEGALNQAKQGVQDTLDNAAAQPGGMQAGFIGKGVDTEMPNPEPNNFINTNKTPLSEIPFSKKTPLPESNFEPNVKPPIAENPNPEYAYAKSSPVPAGAEKLPPDEALPVTKAQPMQAPYPDVPLQPQDMSAARTGTHPLTGGNPVLVDLRNEATRNPYYLEDQKAAQDVIDKYVPGDTPVQVENNLPIKLTEESHRIKNIIGSDPEKANISELIAQNEANLKNQGFTPGNSEKADTATRGLLNEFDSQISAKESITGKTEASGNDLLNYKKILDKRLQSVYKKLENGTTPTAEDTAALTLRRTINDKFKQLYPEAGQALDRQSAMMDARPSIAKAAGQQLKADTAAAIEKANAPKQNILQKAGKFIKENPILDAAGVYAGTQVLPPLFNAGVAALESAQTASNPSSKNSQTNSGPQNSGQNSNNPYDNQKNSHVSDIPQNVHEVKRGSNGWAVPLPNQILDNNGNPIGYDPQTAKTLIAGQKNTIQALQKEMSDPGNVYNESLQRTDGHLIDIANTQISNINQLSQDSNGLFAAAKNMNIAAGNIEETEKMLNSTSPSIGDINDNINKMRKALSPDYAVLSDKLGVIQGQIGNSMSGRTKAALMAELENIGQTLKFSYGQTIIHNGGGAQAPITKSPANLNPQPQSMNSPMPDLSNSGHGVAHPFIAQPAPQTLPPIQ